MKRLKTAAPKPPWYDRTIKQAPSYLKHLKNKTTPFPRVSLSVKTLKSNEADLYASWTVSLYGEINIEISTYVYDRCMKNGLEWELVHIIQHEYMEAKIAISKARKKYPNLNPYVMVEKDASLGGESHTETIRTLDNLSESVYNSWLTKINNYLKQI